MGEKDDFDFDSSPLFWAAKHEQESTLRILMDEELQLPEIYKQPTGLPLHGFICTKLPNGDGVSLQSF